jgi:hypothetical protein
MIMQGPLPMPGRVVAENLAPDSLMLEIFLGPLTTLWAAVTFAVTATGMRYDALQKDPEQPFWPSRETIRKTQRRRYAQALRKLAAKRQAQEPDSQARAAARRTQKRMISVLAIPIAGASLALRLLGAGVFVASFYEPSLQLAPPYAQEKLTLSVAAYASVMLVLAILPALFALLAAVGNAGWAPALRRFHRWASFALLVHILSLMASIAHMGLSSFPVVYYMPVSTIPRLMSVYLGVPEDPLAFVVALESGALVAVIYLQPRWSGGGKKRKT